jgi:Flp pilus assembly protein TadD
MSLSRLLIKAIALNPNESSYYSAKANVLTSLGRKEEALKARKMADQLGSNMMAKSHIAANEAGTDSLESKDTGAKINTTKNDVQNIESKKWPGFESISTIISILAIAFLTFARKQ